MRWHIKQVTTHIQDCPGDSNQYISYRRKPNTYDIHAPTNKPRMATFHKDPMRPKLLRYTQDEVMAEIIQPDRRPELPHSPTLMSALEFVQVSTKLC
jgi:hypothetical protein